MILIVPLRNSVSMLAALSANWRVQSTELQISDLD
jgi:hypothetical protein